MGLIENGIQKVKELDKLLTGVTNLIKKHWLLIIVISIGALAYLIVKYDWNPQPVNQKLVVDTIKVKEIIDTVKIYKTEIVKDTVDEQ